MLKYNAAIMLLYHLTLLANQKTHTPSHHLLISIDRLGPSKLGLPRVLILEVLRLDCLYMSGSSGSRPVCLAKRLRISVRLMIPISLPEFRDPDMAVPDPMSWILGLAGGPVALLCACAKGLPVVDGSGVEGIEDAGDESSTSHIL